MVRNSISVVVLGLLVTACSHSLGDENVIDESETPDTALPAGTCEDSDDCGDAELCFGGQCQPVAPGGCTSKMECGAGDVCVDGECTSPPGDCTSADHCPGAQLCDGFSRACFDPNATGCLSAADCALEPGCEGGACTCNATGGCVATSGTDPVEPDPVEPDPVGPDPVEPDPVEPDPVPTGNTLSLAGYVLENREHDPPSQVGVLPAGTALEPGQRLIIARDASRAAFEAHWGVTLGNDVVFLNAQAGNNGVPIVNGGEKWAIVSPVGTDIDGDTIAGASGNVYTRTGMGAASNMSSWSERAPEEATPGSVSLPTTGVGLVISEWADSPGTGNFVYEYVEIYYAP